MASQIRNGNAALATWNRVVPLGATPSMTYMQEPKGWGGAGHLDGDQHKQPEPYKVEAELLGQRKKIGTVISIIETAAMNIPSRIRTKNMISRIKSRLISKLVAHSCILCRR